MAGVIETQNNIDAFSLMCQEELSVGAEVAACKTTYSKAKIGDVSYRTDASLKAFV